MSINNGKIAYVRINISTAVAFYVDFCVLSWIKTELDINKKFDLNEKGWRIWPDSVNNTKLTLAFMFFFFNFILS